MGKGGPLSSGSAWIGGGSFVRGQAWATMRDSVATVPPPHPPPPSRRASGVSPCSSHAPQRTTPPGGRRAPRSHLGLCGRCWAWHGAGSGGSSTSGPRSPVGDEGALRAGARPGAAPRLHTQAEPGRHPQLCPWLPAACLHAHLQLPHHKLLGHVVPLGLPEDRRVAQVMLQTPALSLGTEAGSGGGDPGPDTPGVPPSSQGTPTVIAAF